MPFANRGDDQALSEPRKGRSISAALSAKALRCARFMRASERVAKTSSNVVITGESGTGKELVAKAIHRQSARRDQPLVIVNCGGVPENLVESELFGYRKGAFTGARQTRRDLSKPPRAAPCF